MLEARNRQAERERELTAGRIVSLVWGFRHRSPNLRRLYRVLCGKKTEFDREEFKDMLAESEERVRKQKELQNADPK